MSGNIAYSDYETDGDLTREPSSLFDLSPNQDQEQEDEKRQRESFHRGLSVGFRISTAWAVFCICVRNRDL